MKKILFKKKLDIRLPTSFKEEIEKTEEALKIDEDDIDQEAKFQPILFSKFIKNFIKSYNLNKKLELEVLKKKNELAKSMSRNPELWNLKKDERITDALVNRLIVSDQDYQETYLEWIEAKTQEKYWESILKACESRGYLVNKLFEAKMKEYLSQEG